MTSFDPTLRMLLCSTLLAACGQSANPMMGATDPNPDAAVPVDGASADPPAVDAGSIDQQDGGGTSKDGGGTMIAGAVARPTYNTGTGFFVLNGKVYDGNGVEFRMRGVDRLHWDSASEAGMAASGANSIRTFLDFTRAAPGNVSLVQTQNIAHKEIPIVTYPGLGAGETSTSCNETTAALQAGVDAFVAQKADWTALDKYMIVNIANEWGPRNSTVWRDSYIAAIASLRGAGYLGPLMIDSGGCGQDDADLLNYSTAVFNSDAQKNIIFSYHVYGGTPDVTTFSTFAQQLKALSASAGMAFVFGEFGPGKNIGPSPTMITPGQIITTAEANGIGWVAWAWDDNNEAGGKTNDAWFGMTTTGPGIYTQTSDLTMYGQDIVLNATYGLKAIAKTATIF